MLFISFHFFIASFALSQLIAAISNLRVEFIQALRYMYVCMCVMYTFAMNLLFVLFLENYLIQKIYVFLISNINTYINIYIFFVRIQNLHYVNSGKLRAKK